MISPFPWTTKPYFSLPLLNFSKPPSVSLIVLIHFWAWLYLLLRASLKGASHGSSWITPVTVIGSLQRHRQNSPVPSAGIFFPPVCPITELSDSWFKVEVILCRPFFTFLSMREGRVDATQLSIAGGEMGRKTASSRGTVLLRIDFDGRWGFGCSLGQGHQPTNISLPRIRHRACLRAAFSNFRG